MQMPAMVSADDHGPTGRMQPAVAIDGADLLQLHLPPLRSIVRDLIVEGTTVVAAPPNVGKSCLMYQVAVEVALGGRLLGRDVGNQLLRHSGGVAEATARRRLGESFGIAESNWIVNGTGSSQPLGILPAILAYGDIAATKYTLSSESRVAALAGGIAKLDARASRRMRS